MMLMAHQTSSGVSRRVSVHVAMQCTCIYPNMHDKCITMIDVCMHDSFLFSFVQLRYVEVKAEPQSDDEFNHIKVETSSKKAQEGP